MSRRSHSRSELRHSVETKCAKAQTPKVPKFGVNLDRSSKGIHVSRLACSGVRRLEELECASVKSPKAKDRSGVA
jgi:hypothetical protein